MNTNTAAKRQTVEAQLESLSRLTQEELADYDDSTPWDDVVELAAEELGYTATGNGYGGSGSLGYDLEFDGAMEHFGFVYMDAFTGEYHPLTPWLIESAKRQILEFVADHQSRNEA